MTYSIVARDPGTGFGAALVAQLLLSPLADRGQSRTLAVLALACGIIGPAGFAYGSSMVVLATSPFGLRDVAFEAISAFGTVGLSTGITGALPAGGQFLLILVMLIGRVGPITFVTALALRHRQRAYRYPEERPIIG